jgi:hypothetical protein
VHLTTGDPSAIFSGSDFNERRLAKLVVQGHSNKVDVETGAGTLTFFNLFCNYGDTRSYYGVFQSTGEVKCERVEDLGYTEKECKKEGDDCSEGDRKAGHRDFSIRVGRATTQTLPPRAQELARKLGCRVVAAFINIGSKSGSGTQIFREFVYVGKEPNCRYLVAKGDLSASFNFPRHLATDDPGNSLAPSDFTGAGALNKDGRLMIIPWTHLPSSLDLPGALDQTCNGPGGATGAVIPLSRVYCGPIPEPKHDTAPDQGHVDKCNAYKRTHPGVANAELARLRSGFYDGVLAAPRQLMYLSPSAYSTLKLSHDMTFHTDIAFVGVAASPSSGGRPIKAVGFADFQLLAHNSDGSLTIQLTSEFCAYDENGNVVFIQPVGCEEGFARNHGVARINPPEP